MTNPFIRGILLSCFHVDYCSKSVKEPCVPFMLHSKKDMSGVKTQVDLDTAVDTRTFSE